MRKACWYCIVHNSVQAFGYKYFLTNIVLVGGGMLTEFNLLSHRQNEEWALIIL